MVNYTFQSILTDTLADSVIRGNEYMIHCPYCNHRKHKLSINLCSGYWKCWVCNKSNKNISVLFKKLHVHSDTIFKVSDILSKSNKSNRPFTFLSKTSEQPIIELPLEFMPLYTNTNSIDYKHAIRYVKSRGLDKYDILRYNIGYC